MEIIEIAKEISELMHEFVPHQPEILIQKNFFCFCIRKEFFLDNLEIKIFLKRLNELFGKLKQQENYNLYEYLIKNSNTHIIITVVQI